MVRAGQFPVHLTSDKEKASLRKGFIIVSSEFRNKTVYMLLRSSMLWNSLVSAQTFSIMSSFHELMNGTLPTAFHWTSDKRAK